MKIDDIEHMVRMIVDSGNYSTTAPTYKLAEFLAASLPVIRAAVEQRNAVAACISNGPELIEAEKKYHRAMVKVEKAVDAMRRIW